MISAPIFCPRFVGRQSELAYLIERRRGLGSSRGGLVLVGGDAGIGKSRLLREFLDRTGASRGRVATGRCRPFAAAPYAPLVELLATLAPAAAHVSPEPTLDAQLGSLADALIAPATKNAIVGIIEDLHWSDSGTLAVLGILAERLATTRMLLVATYRANELGPEHPHFVPFGALQRNRNVAGIVLAPLPAHDIRDFISATLANASGRVPLDLRRTVANVAEGNPFFIEELLKGIVDREELRQADRSLPTTVRAAIRERIQRLAAADRAVLTQAAVIGRRFEANLLAHTLEAGLDDILAVLQRARALQIVEETDDPTTFRFRHALTREAIYDELLLAQRRLLHRRIAEALEAQTAWNVSPDALAYHWWAAGNWAKALEYGERGGDAAQELHSYADSIACYERTLSLLDPVSRDAARVHAKIGMSYFRSGTMDRAIERFQTAWTFFRTTSDDAAYVFALARKLAAAMYNNGQMRESAAFLRDAVDVVARCGDSRITERARVTLASYLSDAGDVEGTGAVLRGIDPQRIADDTGLMITFWQTTCRVCALEGDPGGVRAAAERVCELAARSADEVAVIDGFREAALAAIVVGEVAVAQDCLRRGIETCVKLKLTVLHGDLLVESAVVHALSGAYEEARAEVKAALPMVGESPTARHIAVFAALVVGLALDDPELLASEPDAAFIDGAFATGAPRIYGPLAALCAQLRAARGEHDAARNLLQRALREVTAGPHVFGSFPLTIVGAQLCDRAGADDVRRLCALTAAAGPPSQHAAALAEAILEHRFGDQNAAAEHARGAAAGFAAIGWPFYEAVARERAGDDDAAQHIRERIGYRGRIVLRAQAVGDGLAPTLTPREWQVAQLVATGKTNRAIAAALGVSVKLVEKLLSSVYLKLGLTSRSQLTARIIDRKAAGSGSAGASRPA